jgi:hypothetical protein
VWAEDENAVFHNTWFSDEAYFHFEGAVTKKIVRFWAREHPHNYRGKSSHGRKVTVRLAISSHEFIGPIFLSGTVNFQRYLHGLQTDTECQLVATQSFMQDGASPHTANAVLNFVNTNFGPRAMSHR